MYIQRGVEATRTSTRDYAKNLPNTAADVEMSSVAKNGTRRMVTTLN